MIAVLVSDAIAGLLSPSCYDSIIMIKKLPYQPDILPSSSSAYNIYVENFMVRDVFYLRLLYVLKLCEPSVVPYSAADASAFFWRFLLVAFLNGVAVVWYVIYDVQPSSSCGPERLRLHLSDNPGHEAMSPQRYWEDYEYPPTVVEVFLLNM